MRRLRILAVIIVGIAALVLCANYALVHRGISEAKASDPRNESITVFAHYRYFVLPNVVVFDLREVGRDKSMADTITHCWQ